MIILDLLFPILDSYILLLHLLLLLLIIKGLLLYALMQLLCSNFNLDLPLINSIFFFLFNNLVIIIQILNQSFSVILCQQFLYYFFNHVYDHHFNYHHVNGHHVNGHNGNDYHVNDHDPYFYFLYLNSLFLYHYQILFFK